MSEYITLVKQSIEALKQPKAAFEAIYEHILKRGQRALTAPDVVGQELHLNYSLNLAMFFSFIFYLALASELLTGIAKLVHGAGLFGVLLTIILVPIIHTLVIWFVMPFCDKLGYRLFGLSVTLERAREVAFAAILPYANPWVIGVNIGFAVLISLVPAAGPLSFIVTLFLLYVVVQSFRVRKHTLNQPYSVAVVGPLIVWFVVILFLIVPLFALLTLFKVAL